MTWHKESYKTTSAASAGAGPAPLLLLSGGGANPTPMCRLLFVLAVLFISRFTDGYIYGIVASMIAVVGVNYVFTYPYFCH